MQAITPIVFFIASLGSPSRLVFTLILQVSAAVKWPTVIQLHELTP